jgi:hypothetical protein
VVVAIKIGQTLAEGASIEASPEDVPVDLDFIHRLSAAAGKDGSLRERPGPGVLSDVEL